LGEPLVQDGNLLTCPNTTDLPLSTKPYTRLQRNKLNGHLR
jgi:hypothetical protein